MSLFDNSPDSTKDSSSFFSACESLERFFRESGHRDDENSTNKSTRSKSNKVSKVISPQAAPLSSKNNSRSSSMDQIEPSRESPRSAVTRSCVIRGRGTFADFSSDEDIPLSSSNFGGGSDGRLTRSSGRGRGSRGRKNLRQQNLETEKQRKRISEETSPEVTEPHSKLNKLETCSPLVNENKDTQDAEQASSRAKRDAAQLNSARLMANNVVRLKHKEMPKNFEVISDDEEIPAELHLFMEKMKKQYFVFIKQMKTSEYCQRLSRDLSTENQRKNDLKIREKQLTSQIEKLVSESIGCLKNRLDELGIEAETPAVFVDKAKCIVNDHYELHRTKKILEAEIFKYERSYNQLLNRREKELTEETRSHGVSHAHARALVRSKIESILGSHHTLSELSLGNDILLTRCSEDKYKTNPAKIRRMRRDLALKQQDWPEKYGRRTSNEFFDETNSLSAVSIEVKKIEAACNLASQRHSPTDGPPSQNILKPASFAKFPSSPPIHRAVNMTSSQGSQFLSDQIALKRANDSHFQFDPSEVNLPKMDMSLSIAKAGLGSENRESQLVLPPHPSSHSNSSDTNDNVTMASQKMTSTPRAEQFEDRLKTIIQSVLSGDGENDVKSPINLAPKAPGSTFRPEDQEKTRAKIVVANSCRTISDLITSEIEKTLSSNEPLTSSTSTKSSPFGVLPGKHTIHHSQQPQISSIHRMTQIIEDSILGGHTKPTVVRGHPGSDGLEGLACPRTKSPTLRSSPISFSHQLNPKMPSDLMSPRCRGSESIENAGHFQGERSFAKNVSETSLPYPAKIYHLEPRYSTPPHQKLEQGTAVGQRYFAAAGARKCYGQPTNQNLHYGSRAHLDYLSRQSLYASTSSENPQRSDHENLLAQRSFFGPSTTRGFVHPNLQQSPGSARNAHLDSSSAQSSCNIDEPQNLSTNANKDRIVSPKDNTKRERHDEISTGFDRLVAYASEVDKRQLTSSLGSSEEPQDAYHKKSTLSMKFKGSAGSSYQRAVSSNYGSSNRAVSSISPSMDFEDYNDYDQSTPPGNKPMEHHFKKRYFAETRDSKAEDDPTIHRHRLMMKRKVSEEISGFSQPSDPSNGKGQMNSCSLALPDTSTNSS